jgi:uncharacterized OsmC-like protein
MYKIEVLHKEDFSFAVSSGSHAFEIDAKGKSGMTPPDVLLASLGSCIGVYTRKYAEGAKLDLSGFRIYVEAEFAKEPPISFRSINVTLELKGNVLDEGRKKALVEFIKNCPVHNTLKGSPHVEIRIED